MWKPPFYDYEFPGSTSLLERIRRSDRSLQGQTVNKYPVTDKKFHVDTVSAVDHQGKACYIDLDNLGDDNQARGSMSNGDKRKVSTDALETLGTIIDETQKRDAIHLAVEPVIAGMTLHPGERISVDGGVAWLADSPWIPKSGPCLGIVDPFLNGSVMTGQRFWFVMLPRMVHSLRHVWSHPDFPDELTVDEALARAREEMHRRLAETTPPAPATAGELVKVNTLDAFLEESRLAGERARAARAESERWLRDFCDSHDCPGYDTLIKLIDEGELQVGDMEWYGKSYVDRQAGYIHISGKDAHGEIPDEFWDHVEVVLGREFKERPTFFSCSC